ncbi:MAG: hypothetical protein JXR63_09150 [Spirochaetales bacterium]|nr:hypothetical protein [Spirochaetales bacterium]
MKKVFIIVLVFFIFSCDIYDYYFSFNFDLSVYKNLSLIYSDGEFKVIESYSYTTRTLFLYPGQDRKCLFGDVPESAEFYISDESVISFDSISGIVTAKKAGYSFIAAYLPGQPELSKDILIDVSEAAVFSDANFKAEVEKIDGFSFYNGNIPENRLYYVESLMLRDKGIASMADLIYFKKLENLDCALNNLTTLDLSPCILLYSLKCEGNLLTELDLSGNSNLRIVIASPMPSLLHCYISQEQSDSNSFGLGVSIEPEIIP